jgi:hypothetical protein
MLCRGARPGNRENLRLAQFATGRQDRHEAPMRERKEECVADIASI